MESDQPHERPTFSARIRTLAAAPFRQVRWKIMAPYALLTLFFAVLGTFLVTRLVTGSLEERFTNQLAEAGRVTSDSVVRRERVHLSALRGITFTQGVPEAVAQGDGPALRALVEPVAANARLDRVEILDGRGVRIYGGRLADAQQLAYSQVDEPRDRTGWSMVDDVLAGRSDELGDKWAQVAWTTDGAALFTAGPIVDQSGRVLGVVLVGSLLDSFLPGAKAESLADITIYDTDGRPLASTFHLGEDEREALADRGPLAAEGSLRERKTLFGREFQLLYGDLRLRNEVVGEYSVALPSDYIATAGVTARWQMSLLFATITVAVLVLGWLLSKTLTGPLSKLVRAARAVSAGDLSARSDVRTRDEIGVLASTFDVMAEKLQRQHLATIGALASAIDARDPYTAGHSLRVGQLAADLGSEMGLGAVEIQHLQIGGYLHDIGKIGVRDAILMKKGTLTPEERELIEQHPRIGLEILAPADLPPQVLAIVGSHHEKLNGLGYPMKLRDDEIDIFPRIAAIADIYDALTTDRPYRGAMTMQEALAILTREAGEGLIDHEVVAAMHRLAQAWEDRRRSDPLLLGFKLQEQLQRDAA